jgi:glutathione S-transferase
MKLYGGFASPYVARVVLVSRLKGLELPLEMPAGGTKSPDYLAMNPIGKMPALEDGERFLAESMVICEYLDEAYPQKPLSPQDPFERAQGRLLARIVDLYLMQQLGGLFRNFNPATRNEAEVEGAKAGVKKALADLEHFMGPGPWALGARVSLADVAMLPNLIVTHLVAAPFGVANPLEGRARLAAWYGKLQGDPVCGPFANEYRDGFMAFVKSRG